MGARPHIPTQELRLALSHPEKAIAQRYTFQTALLYILMLELAKFSPLQAGLLLHSSRRHLSGPGESEEALVAPWMGRVVAAQLASLALREHISFPFNDGRFGVHGLVATRRRQGADALAPEEELLLDILFDGAIETRIARDRADGARQGKQLFALVRKHLRQNGLGVVRRRRYHVLKLLRRLEKAMRENCRPVGTEWSDAPELYTAAYPFAVLFALDSGSGSWPNPPEDDFFIPSLLPYYCAHVVEEFA